MIEFLVLGHLEAVREGRALSLGPYKQRALLACLLLERNSVVSMDRLVDILWGEEPPASAANSVHVYVSRLRRLLEPDDRSSGAPALVTQAPGYVLYTTADAVDVDRFERQLTAGTDALRDGDASGAEATLARALALWRGPALAEFVYEPFAQPEIARLDGLRLEALGGRLQALLALGRETEAVRELPELVAQHPLDERLRGQLMLALYRSGRQAEALETYRAFMRLLRDELGLAPSPELRTLEQAILNQAPSLGATVELASTRPLASQPVAPHLPEVAHDRAGDELRPVTALFADIVGSTALGERLAPDEVKALVGECVSMLSRAVEEYGGTVQAYQGDGICAYFGVPVAHADDPERAARAALRILEVVRGYTGEVEEAWGIRNFAVRVGINSGQAAVGLVGGVAPGEVALGDATNVAARLQAHAKPGTILVGEATERQLARRFVFEPTGDLTVKGREAPVHTFCLLRLEPGKDAPPATPVVGREDELGRLRAVLGDVVAGRGRVVVLLGEPGSGKTRLLGELHTMAGENVVWLEGHCLSYGGLPSWPFLEILLGWLGAEIGEPEIAVRTKARAKLESLFDDPAGEVLGALGGLLRIRLQARAEPENQLDLVNAYMCWLEALATRQPVILVLEDAQWADASTRTLAEAVLALTDRAPVGLVVTEEPAHGSGGAAIRLRALGDYGHRATEISLGPLSDEAAGRLVVGILGSDVDAASRRRLVGEAEGNPLYLEELARALQEGALEPRGRTWTITLPAGERLPPALENLLVARIDRLPETGRRLAQIGASIGRTFPVRVLEVVAGEDVREGLATLYRGEVVRESRRYPELECTFAHGLLQEAALSTLTAARSRDLHAKVAAAYESLYADSLGDHLERLAHYHAQAGNLPRALEYAEQVHAALASG